MVTGPPEQAKEIKFDFLGKCRVYSVSADLIGIIDGQLRLYLVWTSAYKDNPDPQHWIRQLTPQPSRV